MVINDRNKQKHYSYLLGLYLGDGCLGKVGKVYRLKVSLDIKYPGIINECMRSTLCVFPNNKVNFWNTKDNCTNVYVYKKDLPKYFPQHGPGKKHTRKIELKEWQKDIIESFPEEFLRGLIHSDGSRYVRKDTQKRSYGTYVYYYTNYNFTNVSKDIIGIFCWVCDLFEIKYSVTSVRYSTNFSGGFYYKVAIQSKKSVEILDLFVGKKQ